MKRIRPSEISPETDSAPLFIGAVTRQTLLTPQESPLYNLALVNFAIGARNKFHRHSGDQVLFITYGTGIVANEQEQLEVHEGELVHIPAREKHWHGATAHSAMSHISLTAANSVTEVLE